MEEARRCIRGRWYQIRWCLVCTSFNLNYKCTDPYLIDRDTVASVGLIRTAHLPFASSNKIIHTFRHALALDERRARFKANLWHHTGDAAAAAVLDPESATATRDKGLIQKELEWGAWLKSKVGFKITEVPAGFAKKQEDLHPESLPINEAYAGRKDTDVKEVWFPGCHAGTFFFAPVRRSLLIRLMQMWEEGVRRKKLHEHLTVHPFVG